MVALVATAAVATEVWQEQVSGEERNQWAFTPIRDCTRVGDTHTQTDFNAKTSRLEKIIGFFSRIVYSTVDEQRIVATRRRSVKVVSGKKCSIQTTGQQSI